MFAQIAALVAMQTELTHKLLVARGLFGLL
jgi:hypothetical protein